MDMGVPATDEDEFAGDEGLVHGFFMQQHGLDDEPCRQGARLVTVARARIRSPRLPRIAT
jgi:hypothetical protein